MHPQLIHNILDWGKDAAFHKMTLDKNLIKPDPRTLNFSDLQRLLENEVIELGEETFKVIMPGPFSEDELNKIRDEAGDVIGLASGIVAKCNQELDKLRLAGEKSLFDDDN